MRAPAIQGPCMDENDAIRTAFHDVTAAQGGSHAEDGGWMWLEGFGDLANEYAAIRGGAYDVSVWKEWTGSTLEELGDAWKASLRETLEAGDGAGSAGDDETKSEAAEGDGASRGADGTDTPSEEKR